MSTESNDPRFGRPSASMFYILQACGGMLNLKNSIPPEQLAKVTEAEKDEITDRGTRIHSARETGNLLPLDAEEVEIFLQGIECEKKIVRKWFFAHGWEMPADMWPENFPQQWAKFETYREERMWLNHPSTLDPLVSGQQDVCYVRPPYAAIIDYKTGFCNHLTGVTGNWQMRLNAVLLWLERNDITHITVALAKPLIDKGDHVEICEYGPADLKYAYDSILYHLWWATQPDAQRVPGEHCIHCPVKAYCPEAMAYAMFPFALAQQKSAFSVDAEEIAQKVTDNDLVTLWQRSGAIKKILEAATNRLKLFPAETLREHGLELPKEGRNLDPIVDVHGAFEFLRDKELIPERDLWETLSMAKGKVAELYTLHKGIGKKEAPAHTAQQLAPWIEKKNAEAGLRLIKGGK